MKLITLILLKILEPAVIQSKNIFKFLFEDTLLGFFEKAYSKSSRKRLSKRPKFYLFDTGVQKALANGLQLASVEGNSSYGQSFEHFIIRELISLNDTYRLDYKFSYYRTSNGQEVDVIADSPSRGCFAIEIKAKDVNLRARDFRGLMNFKDARVDAELICSSLAPRPREEYGVLILPWKQVFEKLFD